MAQQASSSSSSPFISRYTYDVFLSFRGEDTRYGFTGNLYSSLSQRGIFTFIDDEALPKGKKITPSLHKAIQESRISIIVFSKKYASSTFCLDELVQILECHKTQKMEVLPVFYDIDPSHVRHQTGSYQEALKMHEHGRFKDNIDKVKKWRSALHEAANLSGWHFKMGKEEYEFDFIKKITEELSNKLNRSLLHIADYPVGLQARMEQIQRLIMGAAEFENNKVTTMLGIHGIGGIGKSTLARAIYNLIAHQFGASYFIANVRENSLKHGLVHIQEMMLSELVGARNIKLGDVYRGIPMLQQRLCRKKVLLVLDDIDSQEQLQATAGGLDWFGPGSIIIITTRDKHLLHTHGVQKLYEVNELDDIEARELFRWNAFKNKQVDPSYEEIINRAVYYACGLPLALEIIGSNLLGRELDECYSALKAYERVPNRDVQKILRVSYDSLETNEKEIFLDIACFFKGCPLTYVTHMLEARGFHPKYGTRVLLEIVREQSTWPQKRNRLWFYEDIDCVLEQDKENDKIEAMLLDMPEDEEVLYQKMFGKMKSLQMLLIKKNAVFSDVPADLPNSLRVLEWWGYPGASLPSKFRSKKLGRLDLSYSYFCWDKPLEACSSKVLRHLILRGCKNIGQIPDMSGFPNLTELCFCECTNLIEIHDSVGCLHNLQWFCAEECTKLKILPGGINLPSLEYFSLRDCSSLVMFPKMLEPMHKLKIFDLEGTGIKDPPPPPMQNLEVFQSNEPFNFFQKLPVFFPNLTKLHLQNSNLTILPTCIDKCHSLKVLFVFNCKKLQEIRGLPPSVRRFSAENTPVKEADSSTLNKLLKRTNDSTTIRFYVLPCKQIPEWFDCISRGNTLCLWFRNELPALTVCFVSGVWDNIKPPYIVNFNLFATINDIIDMSVCHSIWEHVICLSKSDHMFMINTQHHFRHPINSDIGKALMTNEWIRGKVSFVMEAPNEEDSHSLGRVIKWTGVSVNNAFSRMENVRFTDPYPPNDMQQQHQQQLLALFNPTTPLASDIGEQPLNYFKAQGKMGTLIPEVSSEFSHQSKDYIELANMKIESTASELHKVVGEVEAGLETKKNQFSKAMVLENKIHQIANKD